jgi:16S rRNA G527 N7-methylase RsmG
VYKYIHFKVKTKTNKDLHSESRLKKKVLNFFSIVYNRIGIKRAKIIIIEIETIKQKDRLEIDVVCGHAIKNVHELDK